MIDKVDLLRYLLTLALVVSIWIRVDWTVGLFCLLVGFNMEITVLWMRFVRSELAEIRKCFETPQSEEIAAAIVGIMKGEK